MKNNFCKTRRVCVIIAIIVIFAVVCCVCAPNWDDNLVSMLSGLLSAFATVVLGVIALLQNKRYKELSDKLDVRQNAPEFFILTPITNPKEFGPNIHNSIVSYGTKPKGLKTAVNCGFWFSSLDKPILNLRPVSITIGNKTESLSQKDSSRINVYMPFSSFRIELEDIDFDKRGKYPANIIFQYENIYGITYQKIFSIDISINNLGICNRSWGNLSIAERVDNNG